MAATCDGCGDPTGESENDCEDFDPAFGCLDEDAKPIDIVLTNTSSQPVHLFLIDKSEDFPCCQVVAGDSRTISGFGYKNGDRIPLTAGRNGDVLNIATCTLQQSEFDAGRKVVVWNEDWRPC